MTTKQLEEEKQWLEQRLEEANNRIKYWRERAMKAEDFIALQYKEAMKFMQVGRPYK